MLARSESVAVLRRRVPGLGEDGAGQVAEMLGDLPLAVAQAARYMAETGADAGEYLGMLAGQAAHVMEEGRPSSYPRSLAAVTRVAMGRLGERDPAAAALAAVCAVLAPEPVPVAWFPAGAAGLPGPLAAAAADPVTWRATLGRLNRSALARLDEGGLVMHRLTKAVISGQLDAAQAAGTRQGAAGVVAAGRPGDPRDPGSWPGWAVLLPHLLALDPAASPSADVRTLACDATRYLARRGDPVAAGDLAEALYRQWRDRDGPDDLHTLSAAASLGSALRLAGNPRKARVLDEDALTRRRRVLGEDHPDTLTSANNLAVDLSELGEYEAARVLDEDTLARRRRVLGDDHPETRRSVNNLAADIRALGDA